MSSEKLSVHSGSDESSRWKVEIKIVLVDINRHVHQNISRACAFCRNSEHRFQRRHCGRPNSEGAGEVGTEI